MTNNLIEAEVVEHSINDAGVELISVQCRYHRYILAEVNTHRMFSRSSASSRAIPVERMISEYAVMSPVEWGGNKAGMQAGDELEDDDLTKAKEIWEEARQGAIENAKALMEVGLHKQVANRLLEPFMRVSTIITATEWDNFFNLRDHPDAQPEIRDLARAIKKAISESAPVCRKWHTPYLREDERDEDTLHEGIIVSAARCARVSYNNHDNSAPDWNKDLALARKLVSSRHMSPFEHVATKSNTNSVFFKNFRGWNQLRGVIEKDL